MSQQINFTWLGVTIQQLILPENIKEYTFKPDDDVTWNVGFSVELSDHPQSKKCIDIELFYKMHYINDPEKQPITLLKINDIFTISGAVTPETKLEALLFMLQISCWHLQGIYAAKTEGAHLSLVLPPDFDVNLSQQQFKQQIKDEWK